MHLIWLHVAAMFVAFAAFIGAGITLRVVAAQANAGVMRVVIPAMVPIFRAGGIAVAIGIVAGLVAARVFGYGAPWLIGAYVLTAIAAGLGNGVDAPWARRLAESDDTTYDTIRRERLAAVAGPLAAVVWLAIVWLMVVKPG